MTARWFGVLLVMLLLPAAAAAELRMISIDARPWAWNDPDGTVRGAFADIVAEMSRRTGEPIRTTLSPFARIDRELESGQQDCTIILWNEARARIVDRGEDVYMMTFGVVARRGVSLHGYDDLAKLTVSVTRNLRIDPRFDEDSAIRKDFDKDYEIGLQKLAHQRLDAVAGAIPTILYIAGGLGVAQHLGDRLVLTRIPLALQCSKTANAPVRFDDLNAALRAMRADGSLARLLARYRYE